MSVTSGVGWGGGRDVGSGWAGPGDRGDGTEPFHGDRGYERGGRRAGAVGSGPSGGRGSQAGRRYPAGAGRGVGRGGASRHSGGSDVVVVLDVQVHGPAGSRVGPSGFRGVG